MPKEDDTTIKITEPTEVKIPKELQEFIDAGVQFGHQKSSVHPKMFPYIFTVRNDVHIINVAKTQQKLEEALRFLEGIVVNGGTILFVATKLPARKLVEDLAKEFGMPYVTIRWYGGMLTNWTTISERVQHLKDLRAKKKSEDWQKYPKYERMKMEEEIEKLEHVLGGVESMEKLPSAIFLVDAHDNRIAVKEAQKKGIPIVALVDTNVNPEEITYPIPANDDAVSSIAFILSKVREALIKNKSKHAKIEESRAAIQEKVKVPSRMKNKKLKTLGARK